MIRITVEVDIDAARYRVAVQAGSIGRALEIMEKLKPGSEYKVTFPIDPGTFFVKDPATKVGPVRNQHGQEVARWNMGTLADNSEGFEEVRENLEAFLASGEYLEFY